MRLRVETRKGRPRLGSPEEAAFLDLLRTTDMLSRGLVRILKSENVSATQYNVLRILRGSPAGLPCGEIGNRMITRDPERHSPARPAGKTWPDLALPRNRRPAHGNGPHHTRWSEAPGPARRTGTDHPSSTIRPPGQETPAGADGTAGGLPRPGALIFFELIHVATNIVHTHLTTVGKEIDYDHTDHTANLHHHLDH